MVRPADAANGLRVLVVEDEATAALGVTVILNRCGYTVSLARDGADALIQLANASTDVLLLDLQLPVVSGFEVLERLGRNRPPVVVMTGNADARTREQLIHHRCLRVLTKPFSPGELREQVMAAANQGET